MKKLLLLTLITLAFHTMTNAQQTPHQPDAKARGNVRMERRNRYQSNQ